MSELCKPGIIGLVLLICTTTGQWAQSAPVPTAPPVARDDKSMFRRIVEIVRHVEERRSERSAETASQSTSRKESPGEPRDLRNLKSDSGDQVIEIFPRDLRKKEKFIQHLTGPLYFSPKCRKHVYRLYHNTRDCIIPAYYKRCARLLTRLAGSPRCVEG